MTASLRTYCAIVLGLAALVQSGCVAAVAGVAGAGAIAGYMYYNGLLYRDYRASLGDSLTAVRTALLNQKFPIDSESAEAGAATVLSKTSAGHTIRVHLDVIPGPAPGDGTLTRIGVRVGLSGDDLVSARILDEISRLMPAAVVVPPAPPMPGPGQTMVSRPNVVSGPPQTNAPPLAATSASGSTADGRLVPIPVSSSAGPR